MAIKLRYSVAPHVPQVWKDRAYDILTRYPQDATYTTTMDIVNRHGEQWEAMTGRHILDTIQTVPAHHG